MTAANTDALAPARQAAADWVVRLAASRLPEAEWLAFEAWLHAAPEHRRAYDETLCLWLEMDAAATEFRARGDERRRLRSRRRFEGAASSPLTWWTAGAVAALALIAVSSAIYLRPAERSPPPQAVYATAKGQRLTVRLADGTRVHLAGATRIMARFDADSRNVVMTSGEAAFNVAHDAKRPFTVAVGDRRVRDIGTEFDIRRGTADIAVTVRQGQVQVAPAAELAGSGVSIGPGCRLRHRDGLRGSIVESVSPDVVFAWTTGRLIYRDQPLRAVVEDLNRYLPRPVRLDGDKTADLRFTGVLTVDAEAPTLARLTALLPVSASTADGAIVIRSREDAR
jgi:transmembrane sensor